MTPDPADFTTPHEVLVEILEGPDSFNRSYFFAYWLDSNQWRGGDGVSGQAFHTDLDVFTEIHDGPVRILERA